MKIRSFVSFTGNCVMYMTLMREQDTYGKKGLICVFTTLYEMHGVTAEPCGASKNKH